MDPDVKRLIEETHSLAKDNHRMLRAIRRDQWFAFFAKAIFWAIVLLIPLYIYQAYLAPLLARAEMTSGTSTSSTGFLGLPTNQLQNLINSYTGK